MESPVKAHFRMARMTTTIGDVKVPAGTTVMLLPGACNRDARKFDEPNTFRADRPNVREHIAFIRGVHSCPGAPLARTEGRISLNRILDRMADISISEEHHGPAEQRRCTYEPTFIMRGLDALHIEFKAADSPIGQVRLAAISSNAAIVGNSLVASWGSGQLDSLAATTLADRFT